MRNLFGLIALQIVLQACQFGNLLILTNSLAPHLYGSLVFAASIPTILQAVTTGGFSALLVRNLSRNPENADTAITAYVTLTSSLAVVCGTGLCAWAFTASISADERTLFVWLALGNLFASISFVPVYDAVHRQTFSAFLQIPCELGMLGITAWIAETGNLTLPVLGGLVAGRSGLQCAIFLAFLPPITQRFRWRFDPYTTTKMLRSGWPVALATLIFLIPNGASIAIVRFKFGSADTAIYGLAAQLSGYFFLAFSLLARVLQPHIAGPHGMTRSMMVKVAAATLLFIALIGTLAILAGNLLFSHVLDTAYRTGFEIYVWLLIAAVFVCGTSIVAHYAIALEQEIRLAACYFTALMIFGVVLLVRGTDTLLSIATANVAFTVALFAVTSLTVLQSRNRINTSYSGQQ